MNSKLISSVVIGLLVILTLAGCDHSRLRAQDPQSPAGVNDAPAAGQPGSVLIQAPTGQTGGPQGQPQPTFAAPPVSPSELSPAVDDVLSSLDTLSKDLDATDTLNDVK
jgi:hypothetical protein